MKSIFEKMGSTYRREGDYLIPNLELPETEHYEDLSKGLLTEVRFATLSMAYETEQQELKAQIPELETTTCRKQLKLNHGVEQRSIKIQDTMDLVYTNEEKNKQNQRQRREEARSR